MVYQDSIPFCAPSQFRLHGVADPDGTAWLAVLDPYNQPFGNLHHLHVPVDQLRAVVEHSADQAIAAGDKAKCTFHMAEGDAHPMVTVDYEDAERFLQRTSYVQLDEFRELLENMKGTPSHN